MPGRISGTSRSSIAATAVSTSYQGISEVKGLARVDFTVRNLVRIDLMRPQHSARGLVLWEHRNLGFSE